jgi:hypothetical protein
MGRRFAGYLSWRRRCVSVGVDRCKSSELFLRTATPKTSGLPRPGPRIFLSTSISSSTMCTLPSNPFVESFYSMKKAFTRILSPMPSFADDISIYTAHPSSAPPALITPSSAIRAADIAMPVTSKILFNLPALN